MKSSKSGLFRSLALGLAVLGGASVSALGTTYYVDSVSGSDGALGTSPSTAWQTAAKVSGTTFNPGDKIYFKRNCTWAETLTLHGSGNSTSPITLDCYDASGVTGPTGSGALPILSGPSGGALQTLIMIDIQYWNVADLEVDNGTNNSVYVKTVSLPVMNNITLDHLKVRNTGAGAFQAGIFVYNDGKNLHIFNNLTISNCDIENVGENGIYVETDISNQTVDALSNYADYYNKGVVITGNYIANTHSNGIIASGCQNVEISYNTVYKAGALNNTYPSAPQAFVGIFPAGCVGGMIEHNEVSYTAPGGDSQAFDLDEGNAGTIIYQYNFSHDNSDGFFEDTPNSMDNLISGLADHCIVRFNVSANDNLNTKLGNGWSFSFARCAGTTHEFYYNTFYAPAGANPAGPVSGATGPIVLVDGCPSSKRWAGTPSGVSTIFKNNIFYCPAGLEPLTTGDETISVTYDHNCFYSGNGGQGTNQLNADPQFLDPSDTTAGLQLALTSPAVGMGAAGVTTPSPQVDYYNYAYDLGTTLGAAQLENVMYFQFENNLTDSSGHANNGTAGGSGNSYVTGVFPGTNALSLNGSGYVSIANSTSTGLISNQLCIDLWVNLTAAPSGYRRLVDKMTPGGTDGFYLDLTPTNTLRFNVRGYQITTTGVVPNTGVWTHIVATYQSGSSMAVYINGAFDSDLVPGTATVWASTNTLPFHIGADNSPTPGSKLNGLIDNVRIERSTLAPSDPLESTAVMLYPLSGNVNDTSGNANNGTLAGSGTTFPATSGGIFGTSSSCMSLNGSGYVTIPNSTSTGQIGYDLGIDLWVNLTAAPSGYRRLVDKMTPGGTDGFYLDLTPTNTLRFNVRGTQVTTTGVIPNTGVWTHIVATYRANATMTVYINGVVDPTGTATTANATVYASTNTLPYHIGADNASTPGSKLNGLLQNVEIWRAGDFFIQQ